MVAEQEVIGSTNSIGFCPLETTNVCTEMYWPSLLGLLKMSAKSHHEHWLLPRKSNLVLLTHSGDGLVGAEELNSLVGVSC